MASNSYSNCSKKAPNLSELCSSGGRWCVIKNNTHFELKDGMHSQLQTDLEDNSCRSSLLGNSVGFVNFTENLGNAKYRAGGNDY